jgi:hypothetical protein
MQMTLGENRPAQVDANRTYLRLGSFRDFASLVALCSTRLGPLTSELSKNQTAESTTSA